jgi:hypothetical protein
VGLTTEQTGCGFPWSLEVTFGLLSKEMNLQRFGVIQALETHQRLDEERLSVFKVTVEEGHHSNTGEDTAKLLNRSQSTCVISYKVKRLTSFEVSARS